MPIAHARSADGITLHWEESGAGPDIVLVPYWSLHPSVFEPITAALAPDHRVVRYDDRGTGGSERQGPHDFETLAGDLEAVAEDAGVREGVAVCLLDAANRAVRVAARRPELIARVVCVGGAPLTRRAFAVADSLITSETVVSAFAQMLETDYRGAVRNLMETGNPQMSDEEMRERVNGQIEHVPHEVAVAHLAQWRADDAAMGAARELGERLTILIGQGAGGGWFPAPEALEPVFAKHLPEASIGWIDQGIISAPELTAEHVRALTRLRA